MFPAFLVRLATSPAALYVVAGVALVAGVWGVGAYLEHRGQEKARAEQYTRQLEQYAEMAKRAQASAAALEEQLGVQRKKAQELNERLSDETAKDRVYSECRVPVTGVQLLERARDAAASR